MKLKNLYKTLLILTILSSAYVLNVSIGVDFGLIDENKIQHSEARWIDVSLEEERRFAQKNVNDNLSVGKLSENPDLLRIQREIIEANPSKLWFNDGRHDYYIHPLKVITFKDGYKNAGSVNCGDGIIFIDSMDIYVDNSYKVGVKNTIDNIHDNSALAFTIGHEIAHWKNTQKAYRSDKESVQEENQADISSLEYSETTLSHGYGGGLIVFFNNNIDNKNDYKTHASIKTRYNNIASYISKASNGRIKISTNGNTTYDGKPLFNVEKHEWVPSYNNNYKKGEETYYSRERTMYVAGQIAFAIKYGVWNRESIDIFTQDTLFNNRSNRIVLVTKNPLSSGYKIIDKFNITPERFQEIFARFLASDNDFINKSCNLEEKYCLQLLAYVYINK